MRHIHSDKTKGYIPIMVLRSEKRFLIITSKDKLTFFLIEGPLNQIKKFIFYQLWGNVVYKVEKS